MGEAKNRALLVSSPSYIVVRLLFDISDTFNTLSTIVSTEAGVTEWPCGGLQSQPIWPKSAHRGSNPLPGSMSISIRYILDDRGWNIRLGRALPIAQS